jgi:beta-lactam-binding protein with PASTA domain
VWAAGIVAILNLAAVGFLVFRLLSGPGSAPVAQVTVPDFVGKDLTLAQTLAAQAGLSLNPTLADASGHTANSVLSQDPVAGAKIDRGATVNVTVAKGLQTVAVPDVRNLPEADALNALFAAKLQLGPKTEAFDPVVPLGSVISTTPVAGTIVNEGTPVAYVLSQGPEPSASPSPSPTPTPTPTPPPPPTPTPTPTPTPPPAPVTVADYRCMTLDQATAAINEDHLTVGTVTPQPDGYTADGTSIVTAQSPAPGTKHAQGTAVDLTVSDPASLATCPP